MPLGKKILEYEKLNLVAASFRFYKGKIKGHEKLQISTAQQKCCLEKKKVAKAVDQRSRLSEKKETKQNSKKKSSSNANRWRFAVRISEALVVSITKQGRRPAS